MPCDCPPGAAVHLSGRVLSTLLYMHVEFGPLKALSGPVSVLGRRKPTRRPHTTQSIHCSGKTPRTAALGVWVSPCALRCRRCRTPAPSDTLCDSRPVFRGAASRSRPPRHTPPLPGRTAPSAARRTAASPLARRACWALRTLACWAAAGRSWAAARSRWRTRPRRSTCCGAAPPCRTSRRQRRSCARASRRRGRSFGRGAPRGYDPIAVAPTRCTADVCGSPAIRPLYH